MASGTAVFQETSAVVGDTIHAEFTWTNAQWHLQGEFFCDMSVKDPDGNNHDYYVEENDSSGHVFLSAVTDMVGTWVAQIKVWDGSNFLTYTDTIMVSLPGETSGTANFQETSADVGDTIHANFTWDNAVDHPIAGFGAIYIKDPSGTPVASEPLSQFAGSDTLSCIADVAGTWTAEIEVWDGNSWVEDDDSLDVGESGEVTLTEAVTCDWVNGFEDHGPTVTEFDLTEWVWAYLQVHSDSDLYGKVMKREWWFKETGQSSFTKRSESNNTCTGHYNNWATWPTEDMGNQYGPGEGYVRVLVDNIYLGKTNNYQVIGGLVDMQIEPTSEFFTGPFVAGTIQLVCNVHVKNHGTVASSVQIELWEYPGSSPQNRVGYWSIPSLAPGETIIRGFEVTIPPDTPWPLGVKVWGGGETEPSW